jgi:hypothetical protein
VWCKPFEPNILKKALVSKEVFKQRSRSLAT